MPAIWLQNLIVYVIWNLLNLIRGKHCNCWFDLSLRQARDQMRFPCWSELSCLENRLRQVLRLDSNHCQVETYACNFFAMYEVHPKSNWKMWIKRKWLQLGGYFFEFLKASIADLITLFFSSLQNSEGGDYSHSGDSCSDPCQFLPFPKTKI